MCESDFAGVRLMERYRLRRSIDCNRSGLADPERMISALALIRLSCGTSERRVEMDYGVGNARQRWDAVAILLR